MDLLKLPKNKGDLLLIRISGTKTKTHKLEDVINTKRFKIIGRYLKVTDSVFEDFVEPMYLNAQSTEKQKFGYMNYFQANSGHNSVCNTSRASFRSLMVSQDIHIIGDFLILKIK